MSNIITIDTSDLAEKMKIMKDAIGPAGFQKLMNRTLAETAKRGKPIIRKAAATKYVFKAGFMNAAIKSPQISGTTCVIPLSGPGGGAGDDFKATGGISGARAFRSKSKRKIKVKQVRGAASVLPDKMGSYGGQPPFINTAFHRVVFTRTSKSRLPIKKVFAIAAPVMPMTRAEAETAKEFLQLLEKRLDHNFGAMFGG